MKFSKYHALGNDYIVIDPEDLNTQLSEANVHMPGGTLKIKIDQQFYATMTGAVCKICEGIISNEARGLELV